MLEPIKINKSEIDRCLKTEILNQKSIAFDLICDLFSNEDYAGFGNIDFIKSYVLEKKQQLDVFSKTFYKNMLEDK